MTVVMQPKDLNNLYEATVVFAGPSRVGTNVLDEQESNRDLLRLCTVVLLTALRVSRARSRWSPLYLPVDAQRAEVAKMLEIVRAVWRARSSGVPTSIKEDDGIAVVWALARSLFVESGFDWVGERALREYITVADGDHFAAARDTLVAMMVPIGVVVDGWLVGGSRSQVDVARLLIAQIMDAAESIAPDIQLACSTTFEQTPAQMLAAGGNDAAWVVAAIEALFFMEQELRMNANNEPVVMRRLSDACRAGGLAQRWAMVRCIGDGGGKGDLLAERYDAFFGELQQLRSIKGRTGEEEALRRVWNSVRLAPADVALGQKYQAMIASCASAAIQRWRMKERPAAAA
ncbi:MAG TPA: hypothetical protein VHE37_07935 [Nevskiaceae bacterium]|nr:hypothetical protein [Nevskiaceae bacterium]